MGWKAKASDLSHHIFPDLTERLSANVAKSEAEKGDLQANKQGALHAPSSNGLKVDGGIRERMQKEDASGGDRNG